MQRRRDWVFYGRAWVAQLRRWAELARQRRQLAMLSDSALKDLGLSRADTLEESERPFWDDPLKRRADHPSRRRGLAAHLFQRFGN